MPEIQPSTHCARADDAPAIESRISSVRMLALPARHPLRRHEVMGMSSKCRPIPRALDAWSHSRFIAATFRIAIPTALQTTCRPLCAVPRHWKRESTTFHPLAEAKGPFSLNFRAVRNFIIHDHCSSCRSGRIRRRVASTFAVSDPGRYESPLENTLQRAIVPVTQKVAARSVGRILFPRSALCFRSGFSQTKNPTHRNVPRTSALRGPWSLSFGLAPQRAL